MKKLQRLRQELAREKTLNKNTCRLLGELADIITQEADAAVMESMRVHNRRTEALKSAMETRKAMSE